MRCTQPLIDFLLALTARIALRSIPAKEEFSGDVPEKSLIKVNQYFVAVP
jgi:hypothetical protein